MHALTQEVKEFARQWGADLVGIAGYECFDRLPGVRPDVLLPGARSVVVIATRRSLQARRWTQSWHSGEYYVGEMAIRRFMVSSQVAAFLEDRGYEAFSVIGHGSFALKREAARKTIKYLSIGQDGEINGVEEFGRAYLEARRYLSYIRLGEEAGLGELGRCSMLVTPEFGPRISLTAVITDVELEPDRKLEGNICLKDECDKCVEYCTSGAIKPYGFNIVKCMMQMSNLPPIEEMKARIKEEIERDFHLLVGEEFPLGTMSGIKDARRKKGGSCGKCVVACPIGRKYTVKPKDILGTSVYQDVF